ncbi:RBBP9/YdeN family alpha/beta hydrolase [Pseudomonas sp. nanlin1]|uniref:RBBP9/YdeN family alpha/beta hydrolase n=1 Tax=Pseudomonas sp. nanlin1 TaxID=3040605 RepID=UPI0038910A80
MHSKILILPGLYDSGPDHWQSLWAEQWQGFKRVEQADWQTPHCDDWVRCLDQAIRREDGPVVLVAHSLACTLVTRWAERHRSEQVRGALLVAPSDTEAESYPSGTHGFTPMSTGRLSFASIVVASDDDPYVSKARAAEFARAWGSELVCLSGAGHINGQSGYGAWYEGTELLSRLAGGLAPQVQVLRP